MDTFSYPKSIYLRKKFRMLCFNGRNVLLFSSFSGRVRNVKFATYLKFTTCGKSNKTRLRRLNTNISPDRLSLTPQAFTGYFLQHPFCVIQNYYKLFFIFLGGSNHFFFHFWGGQFKKKSSEWIIHGSHIHVKCLLKALVFGT